MPPDPDRSRNGDIDPTETQEWLDALRAVLRSGGPARARFLMQQLQQEAMRQGIGNPFTANTPYINTIPPEKQAP